MLCLCATVFACLFHIGGTWRCRFRLQCTTTWQVLISIRISTRTVIIRRDANRSVCLVIVAIWVCGNTRAEFQCQDVIDNRNCFPWWWQVLVHVASYQEITRPHSCMFFFGQTPFQPCNSMGSIGFLTDSEEVQYWSGYASWLKVVNVWACKNWSCLKPISSRSY